MPASKLIEKVCHAAFGTRFEKEKRDTQVLALIGLLLRLKVWTHKLAEYETHRRGMQQDTSPGRENTRGHKSDCH